MREVTKDGVLYALHFSPVHEQDILNLEPNATEWFGEQSASLQGSMMLYDAGKEFKTHKHKINPRTIETTQECFVVLTGKIEVSVSVDREEMPTKLIGYPGDIIFVWGGWHGLKILADKTIVYELKAGSWGGSVAQDKEFLND